MLERRGQHDCLDTIDRIKDMCSAYHLEAKAEIDKANEKAEARISQANEYAYRQAHKLEDIKSVLILDSKYNTESIKLMFS